MKLMTKWSCSPSRHIWSNIDRWSDSGCALWLIDVKKSWQWETYGWVKSGRSPCDWTRPDPSHWRPPHEPRTLYWAPGRSAPPLLVRQRTVTRMLPTNMSVQLFLSRTSLLINIHKLDPDSVNCSISAHLLIFSLCTDCILKMECKQSISISERSLSLVCICITFLALKSQQRNELATLFCQSEQIKYSVIGARALLQPCNKVGNLQPR